MPLTAKARASLLSRIDTALASYKVRRRERQSADAKARREVKKRAKAARSPS